MRDFRERRAEWRAKMEYRDSGNSHIWTGIFIVLIGVAALVKVTNPDLPAWIFTWKMFLVVLGLFIGLKHRFRGVAWFILMLVGGAFLVTDIYPDISIRQYIWPVAIIAVGALIIFRPGRKCRGDYSNEEFNKKATDSGLNDARTPDESFDSKEDFIDATSVFGGVKKNIISKNFKGGDLVSIFGGTELDLTRADFKGTAVLELTTIFGGTKLVVPSDWTVRSEAVTIFGGLEDKRNLHNVTNDPDKLLVLRGTVIFGGTEIKSF